MIICKHLEKKIKVVPDGEALEIMDPIELEYYLLESSSYSSNNLSDEKTYGFEIIKSINNKFSEKTIIKDFSSCKENALNILGKFVSNVVTPLELPYLMDDIIGII